RTPTATRARCSTSRPGPTARACCSRRISATGSPDTTAPPVSVRPTPPAPSDRHHGRAPRHHDRPTNERARPLVSARARGLLAVAGAALLAAAIWTLLNPIQSTKTTSESTAVAVTATTATPAAPTTP